MPVSPDSRAETLAKIYAMLDQATEPVQVTVVALNMLAMFRIEPPERGTDCEEDVLYILGEAASRLSTPQVLSALEAAGLIHGESTVKLALAKLIRDGKITNRSDVRPRGYGLSDMP